MPDSNLALVFQGGVEVPTSALTPQSSILERLVRSLVAEKLLDPSRCHAAGVFLSIECNSTGRIRLLEPVYVQAESSTRQITHPLKFLEELQKRRLISDDAGWKRVREEIENSLDNLSQALDAEHRRSLKMRTQFKGFVPKRSFSSLVQALGETGYGKHAMVGFEQLVMDGHPLTPAAKVRVGMDPKDAARYGPEFGAKFGLRFVAVAKDSAEAEDGLAVLPGMRISPVQDSAIDLFQDTLQEYFPNTISKALNELSEMGKQSNEYALIPVHPHQFENAIPSLHANAITEGTLVLLRTTVPARPLMSYRTLSVRESGAAKSLHIKTALEVLLTGAIRGVSSTSARNGPRMSRLLSRIISNDLDLRRTDLTGRVIFIPELAIAGISFKESKRTVAAILRDDVENGMAHDEIGLPISALFARSPLTGRPILQDLIAELDGKATAWLRAFAEMCIPPLFILLSRYGVALEPHPQNMVLILRNGWPHRFAVRDFGGARVLPPRLAEHGLSIDLDANTGLVIDKPDIEEAAASLRAKIFYPLFGNSFSEIIATLSKGNRGLEKDLWGVVRSVAQRTASYIGTDAALKDAHALLEEPWQRKCLLKMRLKSAVTDQLYVDAPNPLKRSTSITPDLSLNETEKIMFAHLRQHDPEICSLWLQELLKARESIQKDYLAGLEKEGVKEGAKQIYGIEAEWGKLKIELEDSATNLALSRVLVQTRGESISDRAAGRDLISTLEYLYSPSDIPLELDSLNAEGHPSHPCRRTRLGFSPSDSLTYDPETGNHVLVKILAIKKDRVIHPGVLFSEVLNQHYPSIINSANEALSRRGYQPNKFELVAAHAFQASKIVPRIYKEEIVSGIIVPLPEVTLACRPTSSTRTLITISPGVQGKRVAFKTAIDVQITSTRRNISHESVRNGPYISSLLGRLLSKEGRVFCIQERAGAAFIDDKGSSSRMRGLSVLVRDDVEYCAQTDEVIIGCTALTTRSPISKRYIILDMIEVLADGSSTLAAAKSFIDIYADLLLSPALHLLWHHGIAIEGHLQNSLLVINKRRMPTKILLRDFAGIRINLQRLRESGEDVTKIPAPHAMTFAANDDETYAKLAHAVILTNLKPVVDALSSVAEAKLLWGVIRDRIIKIHSQFVATSDPIAVRHANDHLERLIYTPQLPQKALVTMRLLSTGSGGQNYYTMQPNPLYSV
ncbi:hypothetical protein TWF694_008054 [Orbilia ellipsospora]|uniref:Uncharacterized protein n=1 Tax=Orbilia ellipsospora TaxID=2528407 RepID=A0AAV9XFD1_9PEZI